MAYDITNTYTLLMSVEAVPPLHTFLKDRYFPTDEALDIFNTTKVLAEYKDGNRLAAPFVIPRHGGVSIMRDGYEMREFEPAHIGLKRSLTIDDLERRGFGEALYPNLAPDQRQGALIASDLLDIRDMISRRIEAMAAECIFTNGLVMEEYADDLGTHRDREIHFYSEQANPATYDVGGNYWTTAEASGPQILDDLANMVMMLARRGLPATEVLCSPEVADIILGNEYIQKLLDNRRIELGGIDPTELPGGVVKFARLNVKGRMLDFLTYADTYQGIGSATETPFIPAKKIAVIAPAIGRTIYGAISQVEQTDGLFHTYRGIAIPKYISSAKSNIRTVEVNSAPLCVPKNKNPYVVAQVLQ